jgi:Ras-related protein Rab-1A
MISSYYRGAHSVILVYDYSNTNSFYSLKNWLKEVKQFAPENCVKYLVCNKIDKKHLAYSSDWLVSDEV